MKRSRRRQRANWTRELEDITRGACGGFLFGIPLLYTMEVWWIGSTVSPILMLLAIAITWTIVFFLNRTEGFRRTANISFVNAARDTVETVAIGLICTSIMLIILQEVTLETQLSEALGKVIFESVPFSLGVALSNQFLSSNPDENRVQPSKQASTSQVEAPKPEISETFADIGATLIGAIIIAFSIAPTDEIPMLAAATSEVWLLATIAVSLLISYGIVFEANFANKSKRQQQRGLFQSPLSETIMSYLLSLVAAAMMLWFFQQLSFNDPGSMWLSYTLLLGLPATIGGAAGRLSI
ncbi:MAG: TIGR02587 family membrane protein [Timaviella obliquedivisa GSE-PSE-MK23-08B]|jgi:putative integral membrane protein (TIGR02587 family)|nr:TIGR02587 family membrane protein [Timaviella obliquedivisa GSE-PSE-MK23-08B]